MLLFSLAAVAQREQPAKTKPTVASAIRDLHTIAVKSKTGLVKDDMVIGDLQKHPELEKWGITVLTGDADALLEVGYTPMTFNYNYKLTHHSGMVLAAGKVTAFTGPIAADSIADKIIAHIAKYRNAKTEGPPTKQESKESGKQKEPVTPQP
jgi:hypothetical protein